MCFDKKFSIHFKMIFCSKIGITCVLANAAAMEDCPPPLPPLPPLPWSQLCHITSSSFKKEVLRQITFTGDVGAALALGLATTGALAGFEAALPLPVTGQSSS